LQSRRTRFHRLPVYFMKLKYAVRVVGSLQDVKNTRLEMRLHRREMREILHRIDTNTESIRDLQADTHELRIENQRILRYLDRIKQKCLINQPQP